MRTPRAVSFVAVAMLILVTPTLAQDIGTPDPEVLEKTFAERPYSPYAGRSFPTRVFCDPVLVK